MEDLKKLVYLYTETNRTYTYQCIYDTFEPAWQRAEAFVGIHNPVDGCSTEPRKAAHGVEHTVTRGTSFGQRTAKVAVIPYFR